MLEYRLVLEREIHVAGGRFMFEGGEVHVGGGERFMLEGGRGSCLRGERFIFEGGEVHVGGGGLQKRVSRFWI